MIPLTQAGYIQFIEGTLDFTTGVKIFFTSPLTDIEFGEILANNAATIAAKRSELNTNSPLFSLTNVNVKNSINNFIHTLTNTNKNTPKVRFSLCCDVSVDQGGFNEIDLDARGFLVDSNEVVIGYINAFSSNFTGKLINSAAPFLLSYQDENNGIGFSESESFGNTVDVKDTYHGPFTVYSDVTTTPAYSNFVFYRNMVKNLKFFGGSKTINLKNDLKIAVVKYTGDISSGDLEYNYVEASTSDVKSGPQLPMSLVFGNLPPIVEDDVNAWPTVGGYSTNTDYKNYWVYRHTHINIADSQTLGSLDGDSRFSVVSLGHSISNLSYHAQENMLVSDDIIIISDPTYTSTATIPTLLDGSIENDQRRHFFIIYADTGGLGDLIDCIPLVLCGSQYNSDGNFVDDNWNNARTNTTKGRGAHNLTNFPYLATLQFGASDVLLQTDGDITKQFVGGVFGLPRAGV